MAKVAMMTDGLRRRPTYEELIDYIEMTQIRLSILTELPNC